MIGRALGIVSRRGFSQTALMRGAHKQTAKEQLPFNPFQNKYVLLFKMSAFLGLVFNIPFIAVYYNLRKKYGPK